MNPNVVSGDTVRLPLADTGAPMWTADRRLCLTEDGGRLVSEDSPDARWLWCVPGRQVPMAEALKFGVVTPEPVADAVASTDTEADDDAETEKVRPSAKRVASK